MICEDCKKCWYYMVCELGCYGSIKTCEYFLTGSQVEKTRCNMLVLGFKEDEDERL